MTNEGTRAGSAWRRVAHRWFERTSAWAAVGLIALAFALGLWVGGGGGDGEGAGAGAVAGPADARDRGDRESTTRADGAGSEGDAGDEAGAEEPPMYTCSMHPSVRLPDPDAKCPICFMALIPVEEDGGPESERRLVLTEAARRLAEIETTPVVRRFPVAEVRLFGKITFDRTRMARITAYFPGRLDRLFVDYVGTPIREGEHLAEIYSPDLLAAVEELRQARLSVDQAGDASELVRSSSELTLEAAREKLRLFGLTPEQVRAAENGELAGDRLTIYAPIGGIVTHLAALEGDYVQTGSPIATVADLSHLWLDLEAYESQLPLLRFGQRVTFSVEAHPGAPFEGRISFIEPMVDDRTRTAAVRVTIDNAAGLLKPGMFATAVARPRVSARGGVISDELAGKWVSPMHPEIVKDGPGTCDVCGMDLVPAEELGLVGDPSALEEPLIVPKTAVLITGTRAVAYVEVPDAETPTYEGREVLLGPRAGDVYVVRAGLEEGERVVTHGTFKIDSAMQLAAKPSMMSMPSEDPSDADATGPAVPRTFLESLGPVYEAYLDAQEALADDDLEAFLARAKKVETALDGVDTGGVFGEALGTWRRQSAKLTLEDRPADIAAARARFEDWSSAIVEVQEAFGHLGDATWRVAYCPMAFDFRGAAWMQRGDVIDNPYFGAELLRCGEIRRELPPIGGADDASGARGGEGE